MWVLEDAEKLEWSNHIFLPLSHYEQGLQIFKLVGITDDGQLIYVQSTVFKSFPIIYIHPTRKTFRRVEYRGIADEDIRQRNGFGERSLRGLQVYPNHNETLLSLWLFLFVFFFGFLMITFSLWHFCNKHGLFDYIPSFY